MAKKIYIMVVSEIPGFNDRDLRVRMPELNIISEIEPVLIAKNPPAEITPAVWLKLAREIYQRADSAIGFVVMHGVDNLLFSACALSYLLPNFPRPVIFTGGQTGNVEVNNMETRANLVNSIQTANFPVAGVGLMFGNRLLRACQAIRSLDEPVNVFTAPLNGILGRIDFSIRLFDKISPPAKGRSRLYQKLNINLAVKDASPLLLADGLSEADKAKDGLIVNAGRYRQLPPPALDLIAAAGNLPVLVWSRKISSAALAPKNMILANHLTWESAVTKFMWARAQTDKIKELKELMAEDVAGEFLE